MLSEKLYTYNNKIISPSNGKVLGFPKLLDAPDNVLIFEFGNGSYDPSSTGQLSGAVWTHISSAPNVWMWDARSVQEVNWKSAFDNAFSWRPSSSGGYVKIIKAGALTIPEILGEDVSPWRGMFNNCLALTDVCALDFPNVTFSPQLFAGCKYINLAGLSVPNTTSLQSAFKGGNNQDTYFTTIGPIVTTSALTNVQQMFYRAAGLTETPYFETSGVVNMRSFFFKASSIKTISLYHTDSASDVSTMFSGCTAVESGALALYNQMSTQASVPSAHSSTFSNCGADTTSGQAELAQIPTSWGGTLT